MFEKREFRGFEKKDNGNVETSLWIALVVFLPIFLMLFLDHINMTGFSVLLSPEVNFVSGLMFGIVVFMIVLALILLKIKK